MSLSIEGNCSISSTRALVLPWRMDLSTWFLYSLVVLMLSDRMPRKRVMYSCLTLSASRICALRFTRRSLMDTSSLFLLSISVYESWSCSLTARRVLCLLDRKSSSNRRSIESIDTQARKKALILACLLCFSWYVLTISGKNFDTCKGLSLPL